MEHAWCSDVARDAAVRAAEDAAAAELLTRPDHRELPAAVEYLRSMLHDHLEAFGGLVEIVGRINARLERLEAMFPKSVSASSAVEQENKGDGMATDGLRTERVTLEVTYRCQTPPSAWHWNDVITSPMVTLKPGESVRVVEQELSDAWVQRLARLTAEREELREQLESVACRAATAETALGDIKSLDYNRAAVNGAAFKAHMIAASALEAATGGNSSAQPDGWTAASGGGGSSIGSELVRRLGRFTADLQSGAVDMPRGKPKAASDRRIQAQDASGGGEGEPVVDAWGVVHNGSVESVLHRRFHQDAEAIAERWDCPIVPLYRSPPQPRGWLTGEERDAVERARREAEADAGLCADEKNAALGVSDATVLAALLARSTPPEVVLPNVYDHIGLRPVYLRADVVATLAAAGVAVKEVGRE